MAIKKAKFKPPAYDAQGAVSYPNTVHLETSADLVMYDDTKNMKQAFDEHKSAYASLTGVNKGSLPLDLLTVAIRGKNLIDLDSLMADSILTSSGEYTLDTLYYITDYIKVTELIDYAMSNIYQHAFYDFNKAFIVGSYSLAYSKVTSPIGAEYVRLSFLKTNLNTAQFELGSAPTTYESPRYLIPKDYLEKHEFSLDDIPNLAIPINKTNFVTTGKNLFDKNTITSGYFVNQTTGALSANATYSASDYIPVLPSTQYSLYTSVNCRIAYYDSNKVFISGAYPAVTPITTPINCAFVRYSFTSTMLDVQQFELGAIKTSYEPYGYTIPKLILPSTADKEEVLAFLPSEICIAVGRTIELYNKQVVWCGNHDNYHFKWVCSIGKSMKRKWKFTGITEKIGNYPLTLTVYDNNMKEVAIASTTIKVVDAISTPINLLPIGDSLTNRKLWINELITLSDDKISFVGTRTLSGIVGGHEGRSGATAEWYLANSSYTFDANFDGSGADGTVNPFWNPNTSAFDYDYYKTTYNKNPNAIQIFLGTNGIANATAIKAIVDGIRLSDATVPIFVVFTLYRGDQDGIGNQLSTDGYSAGSGVWKLEEDRKVFNLAVKVNELLKDYTNLHFVPIAQTHDSEYNFGSVETPVNPRAIQTELMETEATHPQTQGYYQMADIIFSTLSKVF